MQRAKTVEEYIEIHPEWEQELKCLRTVANSVFSEETIKWGAPAYTVNGKNVLGIGAFKSYVGLWFHQGSFLKDEAQVLYNAQDGKTKGLRQWRFHSIDEMDLDLIKMYMLEAIENQIQGKEIKVARKGKEVDIPIELKTAFKESTDLKSKFESLSPGKQREYAQHIAEAKREATRITRLEKCIPMILEGKGLYDKYKNC